MGRHPTPFPPLYRLVPHTNLPLPPRAGIRSWALGQLVTSFRGHVHMWCAWPWRGQDGLDMDRGCKVRGGDMRGYNTPPPMHTGSRPSAIG